MRLLLRFLLSGVFALGGPKTKKNRRTTRCWTLQTVEAFSEHLRCQIEDIERLGDRYKVHGLVFTSNTRGLINPSNLRQRSLGPLLRAAGLPHIRFYNLRHTCATLLLGKGFNVKVVSEMLGHPP